MSLSPNIKESEEWISRGDRFVREKDNNKALECYSRALQLNPRSSFGFFKRANVLYELNYFKEGLKDYTDYGCNTYVKGMKRAGARLTITGITPGGYCVREDDNFYYTPEMLEADTASAYVLNDCCKSNCINYVPKSVITGEVEAEEDDAEEDEEDDDWDFEDDDEEVDYEEAYEEGYQEGYKDGYTFAKNMNVGLPNDKAPIFIACRKSDPEEALSIGNIMSSKILASNNAERLKKYIADKVPEHTTDLFIINLDVYNKTFVKDEKVTIDRLKFI